MAPALRLTERTGFEAPRRALKYKLKGGGATDKSNPAIVTRTHRICKELYDRVEAEASKTGNAVSNEMNSLILDGFRFREGSIVIHRWEVQSDPVQPHIVQQPS